MAYTSLQLQPLPLASDKTDFPDVISYNTWKEIGNRWSLWHGHGPLLEELRFLWSKGVRVQDASNYRGQPSFLLCAIVLWTIHNFPTYGTIADCTRKGFKGCPVCRPNTKARRFCVLRKVVFDHQAQRELPVGHNLWQDRIHFRGQSEVEGPP
jgi:hypothetical protein